MATGKIIDSLQHCRTLKYAHTAAVTVGDVIATSTGIVLIAINDAAANAPNAYLYIGKVKLPKEASLIDVGERVYWNSTAGNITKNPGGNTFCGVCIEAAASEDAEVIVHMTPTLSPNVT
jgi:predicted RecA/RadA family phage recombinase